MDHTFHFFPFNCFNLSIACIFFQNFNPQLGSQLKISTYIFYNFLHVTIVFEVDKYSYCIQSRNLQYTLTFMECTKENRKKLSRALRLLYQILGWGLVHMHDDVRNAIKTLHGLVKEMIMSI